jgi:hypothetical protein
MNSTLTYTRSESPSLLSRIDNFEAGQDYSDFLRRRQDLFKRQTGAGTHMSPYNPYVGFQPGVLGTYKPAYRSQDETWRYQYSPSEAGYYLGSVWDSLGGTERQALRQYLNPSYGLLPGFPSKRLPAGRTNRDVTFKTPERPPYMPTLTPQEAMDIRRRAIMSGMGENFARALEAQRLAEVERQFREDAARKVRSRYMRYAPENQAFINRMNEEAIKERYPIIPSDLS